MTAPDLLRQAAALLEETALKATPGPWKVEYSYGRRQPQALFVECPAGEDCGAHLDCHDGTMAIGGMEEPGDNVWASLLGPQVATGLAAWLRAEAGLIDNPVIAVVGDVRTQVPNPAEPYALVVARVIVGDAS